MAPFGASAAEALPLPESDRRVNAVLEIAATLANTLDLGELLEGVMLKVSQLLSAEYTTLFLIDHERNEVWTRVFQEGTSHEIRLPLGEGIAGYVAETGNLVNVGDAYVDPRFNPDVDRVTGFRTRAMLTVPVRGKKGEIIGVAQSLNKRPGFDAEDVETLVSVAPLIGLSIENAQLYTAARRQNEALQAAQSRLSQKVAEVDLLLAIEREVSSASSVEVLLKAVLPKALGTLGAQSVAVLLTENEAVELHSLQPPTDAVTTTYRPMSELQGIVKEVLGNRMPAFASREQGHFGTAIALAGFDWTSALCVPLLDGEGPTQRLVGVIEWSGFARSSLHPDDWTIASTVAGQVARAVTLCRARVENERNSRLAALGQMLGGLVHDMRSPMTVIGGYAELLSREADTSVRERYSNHILSQLDYVNSMTRDVLAFVRGERQLLPRRTQLSSFWQEMLPVLTRELTPRNVELKLNLEYTGAARFDAGKLKRLITNLARNAAQAMSSGGEFRVTCRAEGETLHLRFADNGPGMPPHVSARIFTAFNSFGKQGGTGLGLALVREVVEAHGGKVTCTTAPGQGTAFDISLPHAVAQQ